MTVAQKRGVVRFCLRKDMVALSRLRTFLISWGAPIGTSFGRYLGLEIGQEKEKECPF